MFVCGGGGATDLDKEALAGVYMCGVAGVVVEVSGEQVLVPDQHGDGREGGRGSRDSRR